MTNSSSNPILEDAEPHLIIAGNSQKERIQTKTPELISKRLFNYLLRIRTFIRTRRCTTFTTPTFNHKSQCNQR